MARMSIITLTTDYGLQDHYVGAIKGVILSIAPRAVVVDITHEVEPQNVAAGAFVLRQALEWFPPGTVHLAVVDPGVGTTRRILVAKYAGRFAVAPDNGLLTWLHRDFTVEALHLVEQREYFLPDTFRTEFPSRAVDPSRDREGAVVPTRSRISATFHGRDIMAPVAAHLVNGVAPEAFGRVVEHVELLPISHRAEWKDGVLRGQIIYVDRFGNLVSNVHAEQLSPTSGGFGKRGWAVSVNDSDVGPLRTTFGDVPVGGPVAYVGSSEFVEIAVNQGSAAERFGAPDSLVIVVRPGC